MSGHQPFLNPIFHLPVSRTESNSVIPNLPPLFFAELVYVKVVDLQLILEVRELNLI